MKPPILLIDVDGVLGDFNTAFLKLLNGMTSQNRQFPSGEPTVWEWPEEELKFTGKEVQAAWLHIGAEHGYFWEYDVKPMPGARDALQRLALLDHTGNAVVYFVTARSTLCSRWRTAKWLKYHGYDSEPSVIVSRNKGDTAYALRRGTTQRVILIDDKPDNLMECGANAQALYLVDHRYNQWCEHGPIVRVDSLAEALEMEFQGVKERVAA